MTNVDEKYANRVPVFFFPWRSHYSEWLRAVLSAHPGVCLLAPRPHHTPLCPLQISSMLIPNAILPPRAASSSSAPPTPLFQSTPPCHWVSAAITFSITSQCEVNFPGGHLSEPITAGGQAEVKWHDLWVGWERGGGRVRGCVVVVATVVAGGGE